MDTRTPPATGKPYRVAAHGWGAHRTIGAALRAAPDGAVISIAPGSYSESLVLERDVTIVAESTEGLVELTGAHGPALTAQGGTATLRGLVLRGTDPAGIAVSVRDATLVLEDCHVRGGRLDLAGWANATLTRCRVHDCAGAGVHATGDARLSLSRCTVGDVDGSGIILT
ncbi:MAG TPA: right-handed parallel beta-helix repeat-containing protein, partial [Rugosimonospora sp.]|nr:right-handed parallel beta-helix repeat-containing protein [Rugosimonospora sp.]